MNLNCETILDLFTFKRRKFLCQIKVNRKSQKFKNTCRCLSQEQWAMFDKKLEKLLTASNKLDENSYRFKLNPLIEVKVQKSKLSFKYFYKLLDTVDEITKSDADDLTEKDLVLECLIDFQQQGPFSASDDTQEYEPKVSAPPNVVICSPLPYKPYTPSKKKLEESIKNNDINYPELNEDTYSPKPLLDEGVSVPHLTAVIPQYTPAPINDRKKCKENNELNLLNEAADEKNSLIKPSSKLYKKVECEYIPESRDVVTHNAPIYIPTPIEEVTQRLCNRDNFRALRKRSNTIDVFSELINENDKEKIITTKQHMRDGNLKFLSQKSLKKRSMTIDEMPAEVSVMPVYIPSPLGGHTLQRLPKACGFKTSVALSSTKNMQLYHNQFLDRRDGVLGEEVSAATAEEEPSHGDRDLRNSVKDLQISNDLVFKTAVEKSSSSEKKLSTSQLKSLTSKSQIVAKNLERIPETQRKENDIKREVYNGIEKCTKDKRSLDQLSAKNSYTKVSMKRDSKIEIHENQIFKKCRRSERSPHKPKRLIEEQFSVLNKTDSKKHKSSLKNKELFGTDDEDEDDDDDDSSYKNVNNTIFSTLNLPAESKSSNLPSPSKKKKHKKDIN